jgi:hypothetical protein
MARLSNQQAAIKICSLLLEMCLNQTILEGVVYFGTEKDTWMFWWALYSTKKVCI